MLLQLISGVLDATDKTEFQDRIADLIEKCDGLTEHGRYLVASIVRRGFVRPRGRPSNRLRLWEISNRYFNRLGGPDRTRAEAISEISTRYNIGQEEATKLFSDARKQVGNPPMRVRGKPGPKPK